MSNIRGYDTETFSKAAKELKRLGLSARVIANLFGFHSSVVEGFVSEITSGKSELPVIWRRFCAVKLKMREVSCYAPSSECLIMEVLSEYLRINTLIGFVEQTIVTMRQLRSLSVPQKEIGYALLLQSVFGKGFLIPQSRSDLRVEAERYILLHSPETPRSMQHIREVVCRAITEEFRSQVLPVWPNDASAIIDDVLLKELKPELDLREISIISRYFGLDGFERQTFREIAKEQNVSPSRIDQIKEEIFEKLRKPYLRKRLEPLFMNFGDVAEIISSLEEKNHELRRGETELRALVKELRANSESSQIKGVDPILSRSIDTLGLPDVVTRRLKEDGILVVAGLSRCQKDYLLRMPNIGREQLRIIEATLAEYGLSLKGVLASDRKKKKP